MKTTSSIPTELERSIVLCEDATARVVLARTWLRAIESRYGRPVLDSTEPDQHPSARRILAIDRPGT